MTTGEAVKVDPKAEVFSLAGTPVLSLGRYDKMLARCDGFGARVKVYYEGGENATHTHLNEDHLFFVLAGQATFHLGRDAEEVVVANAHEGVLLPRGAYYRFQSSGDGNLVMLRVGAWSDEDRGRTGPDGLPLPGNDPRNKHVNGVAVPGAFFKAE
jgi:mannose-6-phosphate isomerase-like protein (cupin superfamily)